MATDSNQMQNIKDKAKETAATVAEKTKEAASGVANKAGQIASTVGDKADNAVESMGTGMKSFAGTLRDNLPDKGMIGGASDSVAGALESGGRYLEEKGLSGIGTDMTEIIKRNPVPAVLLALGLGYLIACATRSS